MKILKNDTVSALRISLKKNMGLLVFKTTDVQYVCLLINVSQKDFIALGTFSNIISYRYVGSKEILSNIEGSDMPWRNSLSCASTTSKDLNLLYYPKEGRILFLKSNIHLLSKVLAKKKVLVVDDSKTIRKLLCEVITGSDKLRVLGEADCPSKARSIIERERPDLITLDIHMPEMDGVTFLKNYLRHLNIPIVMISSVSMQEGPLVLDALANGALAYIEKPTLAKLAVDAPLILERLEKISFNGIRGQRIEGDITTKVFSDLHGIVSIGASTGGIHALEVVLTALPQEIPPVLIVQHIPAGFSKSFAERLNALCSFVVKEASDGEILCQNTVYIAPGEKQLHVLDKNGHKEIVLNDDPHMNLFRPSVDYMFNSLSKLEKCKHVGVILTGMGKDGAQGLLRLKENGAMTIAQDECSSVVFGMPKEAIRINAVQEVVSLIQIAEQIVVSYNNL